MDEVFGTKRPTVTVEYIRELHDGDEPVASGELWRAVVDRDTELLVYVTDTAMGSGHDPLEEAIASFVLGTFEGDFSAANRGRIAAGGALVMNSQHRM